MTRIFREPANRGGGSHSAILRAHRGRVNQPSFMKVRPSTSRLETWEHELDGLAPKIAPRAHVGIECLAIIARIGLSVFLTTGFAAGLRLYRTTALDDPTMVRACATFFFWALALISCLTSRRS
jgi:hypothetical protein